jgi:hypothetical protein
MFDDDVTKSADKVPGFNSLKSTNYDFEDSADYTNAKDGVAQNAIIKASHYNAFLN